MPPGGDASRMTTTDEDEVFMQKVYIGGMRSGKNVDNIIRYHRHLEEEGWDIAEARCDKFIRKSTPYNCVAATNSTFVVYA